MFDWTADLTGTGDRSEYTVESYQISSYNYKRDTEFTDIEALSACIRSSALLFADDVDVTYVLRVLVAVFETKDSLHPGDSCVVN